jgi:farnesyl-diphosphate farnesyltransferase
MNPASADLLTDLLKSVSRSFYLTLRVLPGAVRSQIGLAYLLARATDTVADTEIVGVEQRLEALHRLRARMLGESSAALNLGELARHQGSPDERILLERIEEAVSLLNIMTPEDRQRIREVLKTITGGQELDLTRFATASAEGIVCLASDEELEDYTYRVAGCVGEFWTKMCRAHLFPHAALDDAALLADGVRFGKGLQLVNILRDLPRDLRQGRCYLPGQALRAAGLEASDLLDAANEPRLRPLYNAWLDRAAGHLEAGWRYTNTLPRRCVRVRLACAWPVLIGVRTLARLRGQNMLDPDSRIKVSRAEVRNLLVRSVIVYPWAGPWGRQFQRCAAGPIT